MTVLLGSSHLYKYFDLPSPTKKKTLLTDLRLYWNVDVLVPPNAGPDLRDWHLGGDHTVAVVAVRGRAGRGG